jgi:hypothetical protein
VPRLLRICNEEVGVVRDVARMVLADIAHSRPEYGAEVMPALVDSLDQEGPWHNPLATRNISRVEIARLADVSPDAAIAAVPKIREMLRQLDEQLVGAPPPGSADVDTPYQLLRRRRISVLEALSVTARHSPPLAHEIAGQAATTMPKVTVTCPRCLVQYNIDEAHLGKTGHCKKCDTTFVLTCLSIRPRRRSSFPPRLFHAAPGHQIIYAEETPEIWNVGDVILDAYEVKPLKAGFDTSKHYAEGGMGLVYRVRHRGWDLDLALKRPKRDVPDGTGQGEFRAGMHDLGRARAAPNIVSCYYVRRIGDIPMVFAEFVEDGSLDDWIENRMLYQGGPEESLRRILDIAIQFAWGLEYAHENRLIHQDVKPDNVMMDGGVPKVTDFGLAKARVAAGEYVPEAMQRSMFVSWGGMTPAFCSPEQIEAALQVKSGVGDQERTHLTRRTDIWSFGVSLLAMFMGTAPCTAAAVIRRARCSRSISTILPRATFCRPCPRPLPICSAVAFAPIQPIVPSR